MCALSFIFIVAEKNIVGGWGPLRLRGPRLCEIPRRRTRGGNKNDLRSVGGLLGRRPALRKKERESSTKIVLTPKHAEVSWLGPFETPKGPFVRNPNQGGLGGVPPSSLEKGVRGLAPGIFFFFFNRPPFSSPLFPPFHPPFLPPFFLFPTPLFFRSSFF
jgi:hypothetical protein